MIASSVTEPGGLDELPADRTAWIIAEGLTYYLTENEMKTLLNRLPATLRLLLRVVGLFPGLRRLNRLSLYLF